MYRAKAVLGVEDTEEDWGLNYYGIPNEDGWVTGYLVEDYMVGPIVEANEDGFTPEWWCVIDPDTIERVQEE